MNLLFVETWGLGDTVQVLPALKAVRAHRPKFRVAFLTSQPDLAALTAKPLVDEIMAPHLSSKWSLLRTLSSLKNRNFDAVFLNRNVSVFLRLFLRFWVGIPIVKGANRLPLLRLRTTQHQSEEWLSMLNEVFPPIKALETVEQPQVAFPTIALHLGSGAKQSFKRIPKFLMENILNRLIDKQTQIIVIEGPEDQGTGAWIVERFPKNATRVSPNTISDLLTLLRGVRLLIAGDTGVGHLATLVGTSVITLAGPTNIFRTAPRGPRTRVIRRETPLVCQPCHHSFRAFLCRGKKCLTDLDPNQVVEQANLLMNSSVKE